MVLVFSYDQTLELAPPTRYARATNTCNAILEGYEEDSSSAMCTKWMFKEASNYSREKINMAADGGSSSRRHVGRRRRNRLCCSSTKVRSNAQQ